MITLTKEQITEIAEELDCGFNCYFNKKTGAIESIMDFDSSFMGDTEPWEDAIKEVEENWQDYIAFEKMSSSESFEVMVIFAESIEQQPLRNKLISALNRSKPFRNFKWVIDNSGDYRQEWFDFKKKKYMEWVEDQVEAYNRRPAQQ